MNLIIWLIVLKKLLPKSVLLRSQKERKFRPTYLLQSCCLLGNEVSNVFHSHSGILNFAGKWKHQLSTWYPLTDTRYFILWSRRRLFLMFLFFFFGFFSLLLCANLFIRRNKLLSCLTLSGILSFRFFGSYFLLSTETRIDIKDFLFNIVVRYFQL